MHIRRILVPLVGSENDRLGLDVSFGLAGDLSARADALFVRRDPEDTAPYLGFEKNAMGRTIEVVDTQEH